MPIHFNIKYKSECIYPILYNNYGPISSLIFKNNKDKANIHVKQKAAEAARISLYAATYIRQFVNDIVYFIESLDRARRVPRRPLRRQGAAVVAHDGRRRRVLVAVSDAGSLVYDPARA